MVKFVMILVGVKQRIERHSNKLGHNGIKRERPGIIGVIPGLCYPYVTQNFQGNAAIVST